MPKKDTAGFLAKMNARNEAIAARATEMKVQSQRGTDPIREERDAERRDRLGQLRAREHRGARKKNGVRNAFGHIDVAPD